jgi:aldose 1-epimerase
MSKISVLCCFFVLAAFGLVNGYAGKKEIGFYQLKKGNISVNLTNWGATIVSLHLPDKNGMYALFSEF